MSQKLLCIACTISLFVATCLFAATETAITIVDNDIVCAIDAGNVSVLGLLDLSAAFDTVDHGVLLDVLSPPVWCR